ncbi:hypothetical protein NY78_3183 [Desulfovibrio sp. TomC]|nr:hypothetical protein NY78_3183 [Desulfovibrio sp. TomC]
MGIAARGCGGKGPCPLVAMERRPVYTAGDHTCDKPVGQSAGKVNS